LFKNPSRAEEEEEEEEEEVTSIGDRGATPIAE